MGSREAKIKRYKEMKELKDKLATLSKAMANPTIDDSTKREYFTTMLLTFVNQAFDELASIEQEKPILEYMAKHANGRLKKYENQTYLIYYYSHLELFCRLQQAIGTQTS